MSDHSRFAPSAANRWMVCQQSLVPLQDDEKAWAQEDESKYAKDGTAKHRLAEWALENNCDTVDALLMELAFAGLQVTTDMCEAADAYVNAVRSVTGKHPEALLEFESRVYIPAIHDEAYGTPDCTIYVEADEHLFVNDAKFGWQSVEADGNWQLRIYALGKVAELEDQGYTVKTVTLAVIQPLDRFEPVKVKHHDRSELNGWLKEIRRAMKGNAIAAGDHCKYCPRAQVPGLCPELERIAGDVIAEAETAKEQGFEPRINEYTEEYLARLLEQQEVVKIFFAAVANWTRQTIMLGGNVVGWEVKDSEGNRKYRDENEAERVLLAKYGDGIYEPRTLRSPAGIEKIWPGAKPLMNGTRDKPGLTERPRTGLTLRRKK